MALFHSPFHGSHRVPRGDHDRTEPQAATLAIHEALRRGVDTLLGHPCEPSPTATRANVGDYAGILAGVGILAYLDVSRTPRHICQDGGTGDLSRIRPSPQLIISPVAG